MPSMLMTAGEVRLALHGLCRVLVISHLSEGRSEEAWELALEHAAVYVVVVLLLGHHQQLRGVLPLGGVMLVRAHGLACVTNFED